MGAQIFSIGYVIAINVQVSHGLGSQLSTLSRSEYETFQAAGYASQILFVVSVFFGKASSLSLLLALSPNMTYRRPMIAVGVITAAWAVAAVLASAFQCSLPKSYLYTTGRCFSQTGFWDAVGVIDILTDMAIMILPTFLLYNLQLPLQKKITVCFAFSFRFLSVGATIFRLVEVPKMFRRGTDVTFESWIPAIATTLEVFFSVFAACVPHLRPFMESIQAGYLSGAIQEGDGRFGYGNDSYLMGKMARSKVTSAARSQALKSNNRDSFDLPRQGTRTDERFSIGQALTSNSVVNHVRAGKEEKSKRRERSESITSEGGHSHGSDGSKAMIIKTTKEWSVSYEDA